MDEREAELGVVPLRLDAAMPEQAREVLLRQVAVLAGARRKKALDEVVRDLSLVLVLRGVHACQPTMYARQSDL